MAAFSSLHFISLWLLVLCAFSAKAAVVSPKDICPKTRNPSLCLRALGPTSGNLTDLGGKAVKSAQFSAYLALDEAQVLGKYERDHVLQAKFCSCYKTFGQANKAIIEYSKSLGLNPPGFVRSLVGGKGWCDIGSSYSSSNDQVLGSDPGLTLAASDALKAAGACDPLFSQQPSTEPADLKLVSNDLQDVSSVLLFTAKQFN